MLHHRYRARCTLCCADCSASCGACLLGSLLNFVFNLLQPLLQVLRLSFCLHLDLHALLQARFGSIELLLKSLDRTTVPILSANPLAHVGEAGVTCLCTIRREDDVLKLQRLKHAKPGDLRCHDIEQRCRQTRIDRSAWRNVGLDGCRTPCAICRGCHD